MSPSETPPEKKKCKEDGILGKDNIFCDEAFVNIGVCSLFNRVLNKYFGSGSFPSPPALRKDVAPSIY